MQEKNSGTVMVVDDIPANLKVLSAMLNRLGYSARTYERGTAAIEAALETPPDLLLLDISMPDMNGFEVCTRFKHEERLRHIPVLFISALTSTEDKLQAFEAGGVDYVTKPFRMEEVHARVQAHLSLSQLRMQLAQDNRSLEQRVAEKLNEVYQSQLATVFALAKLAERRDNDTGRHVERVQAYAKLLAEELQRTPEFKDRVDDLFIRNLFHAAPLHDVGKVAVPDEILLKPGRLTTAEFEIMKTHTIVGYETLQSVHERYPNNGFLGVGVTITRSHHERWDGTGYPDGLSAQEIPLEARIMAVADVYDALRFKRVYKDAYSHQESSNIILAGSGTHFDPAVVGAFSAVADTFDKIVEAPESHGEI